MKIIIQIVFITFLWSSLLDAQQIVRYQLTIADTTVNFSGKDKRAIAVNGKIPMPTLTFTEGERSRWTKTNS